MRFDAERLVLWTRPLREMRPGQDDGGRQTKLSASSTSPDPV